MPLTSLQAALLFCRLPKLGPRSVKKLIDHSGYVKNALQQKPDKLLEISGIGKSHLKEISQRKAALPKLKKEEIFIKKMGLTLYIYGEKNYPITLAHSSDLPTVFFQKGEVNWSNKKCISIVGTRNPTQRGIAFCQQLIEKH